MPLFVWSLRDLAGKAGVESLAFVGFLPDKTSSHAVLKKNFFIFFADMTIFDNFWNAAQG